MTSGGIESQASVKQWAAGAGFDHDPAEVRERIAACQAELASAVGGGRGDGLRLVRAAQLHLTAGLPSVQSGDYMGEHWLATFAVYATTDV